ncbi:hypothetical protein Cni_G17053 [Canna indica]|uniref:Plastid division protein PDV1 n=1 Tax=Canna indica TaxID=4628 RepID=A0AAQ3KIN3_9LILI|nr:hypothetical protein Cni_G17053 [Canna indica]
MRWEMEMEEVEAVLERIWELHDKISDAIHGISRSQFIRSVKSSRGGREPLQPPATVAADGGDGKGGFVFVKDFRAEEEDGVAMAEVRSLNAIRTALENLEDQLEFFHTVQSQQRAERDAAIARLEQSRIILAMRLADHQGRKYKFIDEAVAFVGDVHDMGLYENEITRSHSGKNLEDLEGKKPSMFMQMFMSSFALAKRSLGLVEIRGVLGNAAIFALSMFALLQLNQVAFKGEAAQLQDQTFYRKINERSFSRLDSSSRSNQSKRLEVLSARG